MSKFPANFVKSIPLPRGPQGYLILYRWLLVAAGIYTVIVTWNAWQVRSAPDWHPWKFATPDFRTIWNHAPTPAQLAPMLPVYDWLPQFDVGWLLVASLLSILVFPRTGLTALGIVWVLGVLMDQTRLQPHYQIGLLMLATFPSAGAQLVGRANLIALWFWAGFHKLIIDFIKPEGLLGFKNDIIPYDLARMFPPEHYHWSTHTVGVALGWSVALTEMLLGLACLFPPLRWIVGIVAFVLHGGIILWNCLMPCCNLVGWNLALMLAGLVLIMPWRDWPWTSWKQCSAVPRVLALLLLVYPATYYVNGVNAYLSHCIYVPNSAYGELRRPGELPKSVPFLPFEVLNFPLPSGQSINEQYFDKIKKPGDEMIIFDPRPWAQHRNLNGRRLTYDGELRDNLPYGHWIHRDSQGHKLSEGDFADGVETGHWTFWQVDGSKAMEGDFVNGQPEGTWRTWTPDGQEARVEFHDGQAVTTPSSGGK
jgi:hypothetical protein